MIKYFSFALIVIFCTKAFPQTEGQKADTIRKKNLIALPVVGYGKEKGFEFGAVALHTFYTGQYDTLTRNSSISAAALYSTKKQSSVSLKADIWQPSNRYHYLSEIKYKNQPFNFYGIGSNTLEANKDVITQKQLRLSIEAEKKTGRTSYIGFALGFENYSFTDKATGGIYTTASNLTDRDGGSIFLLGIVQTFDSRNSINYSTSGAYARLNLNFAPNVFGGENFTGSQIKFNGRYFSSITKKSVLALNAVYQTMQAKNVPFYLLPQLGNDEIMRGYYSGRYRDQNLLATQAELRYRFFPILGIVAFGGTGTVFSNGSFNLSAFKPNYGGGLRYFFDQKKGLSIRFDYGIGEKRSNEKRQTGFYVSFAEAF